MGKITLHETLALRWAELCNDPSFHDLHAKIELNGMGVIEMSPATNRHARQQAAIGTALGTQMPEGTAFVECSVATTDGVRVPDVAWASADFMATFGELTPFPSAPEICVEVRAPSNTDAPSDRSMTQTPRAVMAATVISMDTVAICTGMRQRLSASGNSSFMPAVKSDTNTATSVSRSSSATFFIASS